VNNQAKISKIPNWSETTLQLRLGVEFSIHLLLENATGLELSVTRLQNPTLSDGLSIEFEDGTHWAVQTTFSHHDPIEWSAHCSFGSALSKLYEVANSDQIDLSKDSADRVQLVADHQFHRSIMAFSKWMNKARQHHTWADFAEASSGTEREWLEQLPAFLGAKPNNKLLTFLKKLQVRTTPEPNEWWNDLQRKLIQSGIPNAETANRILNALLAQVTIAAQYIGYLEKRDLRRVCQITEQVRKGRFNGKPEVQLRPIPKNRTENLKPCVDKLHLALLILLLPLVFLVIGWYFFPPDTLQAKLVWCISTIGGWTTFLANLSQFTGFSLRDIWTRGSPETRWARIVRISDLVLLLILLVFVTLISLERRNRAYWQKQPTNSDKIVVLVAEFSKGASYEVPSDRTITHKIIRGLEELETKEHRVTIERVNQVILNPDDATTLGIKMDAVAVIWGTYTPSPTSILIEPHLKIISPSVAVFAEDYPTEPKERIADIEAFYTFDLHLELQQEMSFLSAFVIGLANYSEKKYDEALDYFDRSLEIAINNKNLGVESVHHYKGVVFHQLGQYAKAREQFEMSIETEPKFARAYNGLGMNYHDQNQISEAIAQYLKAIECDPTFASAYNNLAVAYGVQNKPAEDRIELYLKALDLEPDNFILHQNLGSLYRSLDKHKEALSEHLAAVQANPYVADSWYYLADLYCDLAEWGKCKTTCQKALDLNPNHAGAHNLMGVFYAESGLYRRAKISYKDALTINPDYASAHWNLGLQYEYSGKLNQAQIEYEKAIVLEPNEALYHCALAGVYIEKDQTEKGENSLTTCKELTVQNPDEPQGHNALGMIYFEQGKYPQAIQEFQKAIKLDSNEYVYHSNLSNAYEETGQTQKAIEEAETTLRLSPNPFLAHLELLRLRLKFKDFAEACNELLLALKTGPFLLVPSLAGGFMGLIAVAYILRIYFLLLVFKDVKSGTNALRPILTMTQSFLAATRWGVVRINKIMPKFVEKPMKSFIATIINLINHTLAYNCYILANVNLLNENQKQALGNLQNALDFYPYYEPALDRLVTIHIAQGNLSTAYRFARRSINVNPHNAIMYLHLGDILKTWNMIDRAVNKWERAIKIDVDAVIDHRFDNLRLAPLYIPAHFTLGLAFESKNIMDKALIGFEITVSSAQNHIIKQLAEQRIHSLQSKKA
jgi:tetratricopeptide (TPR) repeat protein